MGAICLLWVVPICWRGGYHRNSRCHCGLSEQTGKTTTLLESTVCQIIRSAFSEDGSLKLPEGLEPSVVYAELQAQAIPGFALLRGGLLDACADNALAAAWLNRDLGRRALFGHLLDVQDEMLSVLEAKGIPTVILKGAAAGMLYPDPGLRSYGDIDFMVSPADFRRARAALVAAGFEGKDDDGVCDHHVGLDKGRRALGASLGAKRHSPGHAWFEGPVPGSARTRGSGLRAGAQLPRVSPNGQRRRFAASCAQAPGAWGLGLPPGD